MAYVMKGQHFKQIAVPLLIERQSIAVQWLKSSGTRQQVPAASAQVVVVCHINVEHKLSLLRDEFAALDLFVVTRSCVVNSPQIDFVRTIFDNFYTISTCKEVKSLAFFHLSFIGETQEPNIHVVFESKTKLSILEIVFVHISIRKPAIKLAKGENSTHDYSATEVKFLPIVVLL